MGRRVPSLLVAMLIASGVGWAQAPSGSEAPSQAEADRGPQRVITDMRDAAVRLLDSLSPELRKQATFAMDDSERRAWSNLPATLFERKGVSFGELSDEQRVLAHRLIESPLSSQGYLKTAGIMRIDEILEGLRRTARPDQPPMFGQALYWIGVFGDPRKGEVWGWQLDGHHLALNFTVVGGRLSVTPAFLGSDPAEARSGLDSGFYVLAKEDQRGRRLFAALDARQRSRALLDGPTPEDVIAGPGRADRLKKIVGLPAAEMTPEQRRLLRELVEEYLGNLEPELAAAQRSRVEAAGFEALHFAWSGTVTGKRYYYRVHGPNLLIEFDNGPPPGNSAGPINHIHTVWRDPARDYGDDLLRKHYAESPHHRE